MSVTYRFRPLSMQFEPTIKNKGNGLDFRSESEVCQTLNSFWNNISPSYSDEKEIKIPTKAPGKRVRACIGDRNNLINLVESGEAVKIGRSYQSNAFKREYGHEDETKANELRTPNKDEGESTGCVGTKCWTRICVRTFERQLFL